MRVTEAHIAVTEVTSNDAVFVYQGRKFTKSLVDLRKKTGRLRVTPGDAILFSIRGNGQEFVPLM